ncbi:MAG: hypothetical protein Q8M66_09340 [Actinomycetota bacterium]|nr:hypothetical protein [Actinomycetota bacterium]
MLTKNKEKKLLAIHHDPLDRRHALRNPVPVKWGDDKYIGASDSYSLILIPENAKNRIKDVFENAVNISAILPDDIVKVGCVALDHLQSKYDTIDRSVECESCDGSGKFEHHDYEYECKPCNGTGYIPNPVKCVIFGFATSLGNLGRLIITSKIVACQTIAIYTSKKSKSAIFCQMEHGVWVLLSIVALEESDDRVVVC